MNNRKSVSNLLIGNVQITYFRMLTTILLGFFTTRLVYQELGEIQFGIFSVVGASIFFITTIQSTLTASAQRHIAFELGKDDQVEASCVFSTSLILAVLLSAVIFLVGMLASNSIVELLTAPQELKQASLTALRFTIGTAAIMVAASPFTATLSANQNFLFPAVTAFLLSLGSLVAAFGLRFLSGNSLENYSALRFVVITVTTLTTILFALLHFKESHFSVSRVKKSLISPLIAFGGWSGLSTFSWSLRFQGIQLLGNTVFGPSFNAALGVGQQLYGYANSLPAAVINVIRPTLTQLVGRKDHDRSIKLLQISTRVCPLLAFFLIGPLLIEMNFFLGQWLVNPPSGTATITTILMLNLLFDHMSSGHAVFFHARGQIKWYSIFIFSNVIAQLFISYVITEVLQFPSYTILLVVLLGTLVNVAYKILYAVPGVPPRQAISGWFKTCFFPVLLPCLMALCCGYFVTLIYDKANWTRLALVVIIHSAVLALTTWHLGLKQLEKDKLKFYVRKLF